MSHIKVDLRQLFSSFFLACLLAAPAAQATKSGFYIGASGGQSSFDDIGELETACIIAGAVCTTDDSDTGVKIFGGYQFNDYVALEGGYFDLGSLSAAAAGTGITATANFKMNGGFAALVPQIPIGKIGAVFGKLGIAVGEATLDARVPAAGFDDSVSGTGAGVIIGVGGAINLGENVTLRVEYERFSFEEVLRIAGVDIDAPDIDLVSGSVLFRF